MKVGFIADTIPISLRVGGRILPSIHIHINRHSTLKHQHEQIHGFSIFPRIDSRSKVVAWLVEIQFETTYIYLLSPYDCLAIWDNGWWDCHQTMITPHHVCCFFVSNERSIPLDLREPRVILEVTRE